MISTPDRDQDQERPELEQSRPRRWIIGMVAVLVIVIAGWRLLGQFPPRTLMFWSAVVNDVATSPQGTNRVRILMTDLGALGYGDLTVYGYKSLVGYRKVLEHAPVDAHVPYKIEWKSESEFELEFVDPQKGMLRRSIQFDQ